MRYFIISYWLLDQTVNVDRLIPGQIAIETEGFPNRKTLQKKITKSERNPGCVISNILEVSHLDYLNWID